MIPWSIGCFRCVHGKKFDYDVVEFYMLLRVSRTIVNKKKDFCNDLVEHGRTGHIYIGVAAGFPSCSMPSGGQPQAGLSAALGVAALRAATDSKFTINSYF